MNESPKPPCKWGMHEYQDGYCLNCQWDRSEIEAMGTAENNLVRERMRAASAGQRSTVTSTFQPWRKFQPDFDGTPHGWIQWKGTDVCLDFHCKCGAHGHVDGDFVYYVKCGKCGQVYEMSGHVEARAVDAVPEGSCEAHVAEVSE